MEMARRSVAWPDGGRERGSTPAERNTKATLRAREFGTRSAAVHRGPARIQQRCCASCHDGGIEQGNLESTTGSSLVSSPAAAPLDDHRQDVALRQGRRRPSPHQNTNTNRAPRCQAQAQTASANPPQTRTGQRAGEKLPTPIQHENLETRCAATRQMGKRARLGNGIIPSADPRASRCAHETHRRSMAVPRSVRKTE